MRSVHATRGERGAGSVLILTAAMVVAAALLAATVLAHGHAARRQAAAAADLAALAGAEHVGTGSRAPCAAAEHVARANGAQLRDCVVDGLEVEVQVRVRTSSSPGWLPDQDRRARAGPS